MTGMWTCDQALSDRTFKAQAGLNIFISPRHTLDVGKKTQGVTDRHQRELDREVCSVHNSKDTGSGSVVLTFKEGTRAWPRWRTLTFSCRDFSYIRKKREKQKTDKFTLCRIYCISRIKSLVHPKM